MKRIILPIIILLLGIAFWYATSIFAATPVAIPWSPILKENSINIDVSGGDIVQVGQSFGFKVLWFLKTIISWFALVFMVMIGAYMVVFSDNEERVKTQRKQILYTLIGFLFLNIPWVIYQIMSPSNNGWSDISSSSWTNVTSSWYFAELPGFVGTIANFFRVFAYGGAVLMLTWGFFRLILSSGDEEQVKAAKSRVLYSSLGLMFLLFIDGWIWVISTSDIGSSIPGIAGILFKIALFFAAPTAIFFIIYGAYYYITSAGDEERVKKWKNILLNTLIASLILIASFTFLTDLVRFTF